MSNAKYTMITTSTGRLLRVMGVLPDGMHGVPIDGGYHCPLDAQNAAAIRAALPHTAPMRVGLRKSIGCGDRLGIATAGHLRAVREGDMFPVLAQQSIREMGRARRSPQQVLDDATWGVLEAGYMGGWGCDADHLKTLEDIDACAAAGYLGYTLDPGAYVDNAANTDDRATLEAKVAALDWSRLGTDPAWHRGRYAAHGFDLDYLRIVAKYGKALIQVRLMVDRLTTHLGVDGFDLEVSVDETDSVTTLDEHRFLVLELRRMAIPFIGIAPRFVGAFEKGVDYIGDLGAFEASFRDHAALACELGGYKLSIHSGSDKFSLYPIIARHANPLVHVKTAGTSWVEALRVIARCAPALFRQLLALACDEYAQNRTSYRVSGEVANIPRDVSDPDLPTLLDQFDAREILHVSFGGALAQFYDAIYAALYANYDVYLNVLHQHFGRHIKPFHN